MGNRERFWSLEHLTDRQLLERLHGVLRTQRCALAELVAHLGEVEERRLHLAVAYDSMFSYCVGQLGMSEDEACRRIELARLARRFPLLFAELESGRISLSVALLLKPVLTSDNHAELIAAARGASLRTAREMLAARFPSPDVPSRIRKLPERLVAHVIPPAVADVTNAMPAAAAHAISTAVADVSRATPAPIADVVPASVATLDATANLATAPGRTSSPQPRALELELGSFAAVQAKSSLQDPPTSAEPSQPPAHAALPSYADPRQRINQRQRIEPLAAERYRIQFTADTNLKQKLELARDLLRHAHPSGDFALIVSRALDLLLQELLQRRFGARRKDTSHRSKRTASHAVPAAAAPAATEAPALETPKPSTLPVAIAAPTPPVTAPSTTAPSAVRLQSSTLPVAIPAPARPVAAPPATQPAATPSATPSNTTRAPRITLPARRAVLERDGVGCCWVDATGKPCGSTAWLELDHQHPSGKGGSSEPDNLRLLCRAHNRFAAERAYGRDHVERAIRARQHAARIRATRIPAAPRDAAP